MLDVRYLSCGYSKRQSPIIRDLSLAFEPGVMTALVGPNGCGKSTLLKAIMGFMHPQSGEVLLNGQSVARYKRRDLAGHIAYLPQESYCPDYLTLGELVELGGYARSSILGAKRPTERVQYKDALERVGLADMAHLPVNRLSGGQKQRAWIAMILAQDAQIVLLDEPVNHLDIKFQYAIMSMARDLLLAQGKTVIAVLHDLNLAMMFADRVAVMKEGALLAHGPTNDTVDAALIKAAFDFEAEVLSVSGRRICAPIHTTSMRVAS